MEGCRRVAGCAVGTEPATEAQSTHGARTDRAAGPAEPLPRATAFEAQRYLTCGKGVMRLPDVRCPQKFREHSTSDALLVRSEGAEDHENSVGSLR